MAHTRYAGGTRVVRRRRTAAGERIWPLASGLPVGYTEAIGGDKPRQI